MSEHERSTRVNVPAEAAFRVVSSLDSIPQFVPHIKEIREDHADEIFGVAEVDGRRWEFSGFFRVSPETRRIDWGSDGTPGYRGWMEMSSVGDQACEIKVHISMDSAATEVPPGRPGFAGDRIERGLDGVLNQIKRLLEEQHAGELVGQQR
jgi:hypothetical protein